MTTWGFTVSVVLGAVTGWAIWLLYEFWDGLPASALVAITVGAVVGAGVGLGFVRGKG